MSLFPPSVPLSKRLFDLILSLLAAVILSPFLVILALLVRLYLGSPVLFKQKRGGYRGQVFEVVKFRSMTDTRDSQGQLLPDEQRLTRLGRLMRSFSLDELPELVNVLRGEMSLVGPRPLYAHYLSRYTPEQARRHAVLPGITGWAQVNGRNALTWEEKFSLDLWYVDHWSLWLDLRILILTVIPVFRRHGINQPGHVTADEFMGVLEDESPDQESR